MGKFAQNSISKDTNLGMHAIWNVSRLTYLVRNHMIDQNSKTPSKFDKHD